MVDFCLLPFLVCEKFEEFVKENAHVNNYSRFSRTS